jgi:HEAT repeat protein
MGSHTAVPALLGALGDRDGEVRAAAATALGRLGTAEAATPLLVALTDGTVPRSVGGQALLALGDAGLDSVRALTGAEDVALRATAIDALGWIGGAADGPRLAGRLRDPAADVRARACAALGRLGAEEGAAALRAALGDRIPFVRAAAATALGRLADHDAIAALAAQAHGDEHAPAAAAATALARIAPAAVGVAAAAPGAGPHLREAADLLELAA